MQVLPGKFTLLDNHKYFSLGSLSAIPFFMIEHQILEKVKQANGSYIYDPIGDCEIARIPAFIDRRNCQKLIQLVNSNANKSIHLNLSTGAAVHQNKIRNSDTFVVSPSCSQVSELVTRIAVVLCTAVTHAEPINIIKYTKGGHFNQHIDAYSPIHFAIAEYGRSDRLTDLLSAGNRTWTAMVYLNDDFSGGETSFPNLGINLIPHEGDLVCWRNTKQSNPILNSLHSGLTVQKGNKFVLVIPFREKPCAQNDPSYYL